MIDSDTPVIVFRYHGGDATAMPNPDFRFAWQVELYLRECLDVYGACHTYGSAWIEASSPGGEYERRPFIRFIQVDDYMRCKGIATKLIQACIERWPGITASDPLHPAAARL